MRAGSDELRRRLRPLYVASFLQGLALWVPIEKLFMASIGFDAATIGAMAAGRSISTRDQQWAGAGRFLASRGKRL